MKRITSLFLLFTLLFCGCQSKSDTTYGDSLSPDALADACAKALGMDAVSGNADELDVAELPQDAEFAVRYAANRNNLDEFGILRTDRPEHDAKVLESYLKQSFLDNRSYYDSYIPAETPKLRDAEVRVFGHYAVYAILDGDRRAALFKTVREQLLSCQDRA